MRRLASRREHPRDLVRIAGGRRAVAGRPGGRRLVTAGPTASMPPRRKRGGVPGLYGLLGLILPGVVRRYACLAARPRADMPVRWIQAQASRIVRANGATSSPASSRSRTSSIRAGGRDAERLAADGVHARLAQARHQLSARRPRPAGSHKPQPAVDGDPSVFSSGATARHARACRLPRLDRADSTVLQPVPRQLDEQAQANPHDMARPSSTRRFGSDATR